MNNLFITVFVGVVIFSIVTIAKNWELVWTLLKGIVFILFAAVGYWLFTPGAHGRYFDRLTTKWFGEEWKVGQGGNDGPQDK